MFATIIGAVRPRARDFGKAVRGFVFAPLSGKVLIVESVGFVVWSLITIAHSSFPEACAKLGTPQPADDLDAVALSSTQQRQAFQVGRAVRRSARVIAGPDTCFPQALAATALLRRRSIPSVTFIGVRKLDDELKSHAWVRAGQRVVTGGDVASQYQPVTAYLQGLHGDRRP